MKITEIKNIEEDYCQAGWVNMQEEKLYKAEVKKTSKGMAYINCFIQETKEDMAQDLSHNDLTGDEFLDKWLIKTSYKDFASIKEGSVVSFYPTTIEGRPYCKLKEILS
jgi:hypothetical protein